MAFTPKFSATFAGRIMENLQTLVERDFEAALFRIDPDLDAPRDYKTPMGLAVNFPAVYVEPTASALQQSEDDTHIRQQHTFTLYLAIVGPDAVTLKAQIVKYVRALDQVLRTASVEDLITGISASVGPPAWEVTDHRYGGLVGPAQGLLRWDAQLTFTIQLLER